MNGKVLFSFDVEEFDLPREHGGEISLEEGVKVSSAGLLKILELLKRCEVKATFFVTGNFARINPKLVLQIMKDGHEVACHGVDHFEPRVTDICESKKIVEKVIGAEVVGYRQPRMFKIDYKKLSEAGYLYDSSVNPAWVPGRYNHRDVPRKMFVREGVVEVPVSVATGLRVPLFWLTLHLSPMMVYMAGVKESLKKTGYFATYFHPWEFSDLLRGYGAVPSYIKINSGEKMVGRLEKVILKLKKGQCEFVTYEEHINMHLAGIDKT
ncbi:polysaccharide deacetylase family protein [Candidatus Saccharibacteria bacterium]|nr:polysaccharide deacetylase family protein [Candidatus Saccharibacteria bacterium]